MSLSINNLDAKKASVDQLQLNKTCSVTSTNNAATASGLSGVVTLAGTGIPGAGVGNIVQFTLTIPGLRANDIVLCQSIVAAGDDLSVSISSMAANTLVLELYSTSGCAAGSGFSYVVLRVAQ